MSQISYVDFTVVGFKYRGFQPEILRKGKISLEEENDNPYDLNAVRVMVDGEKVGYVTADTCVGIRTWLSKVISVEVNQIYKASADCSLVINDR